MEKFKTLLYHYFVGVLISASIVCLIILYDYFINGYLLYPELSNFVKVCLISGIGFGLTHFASIQINKSKNTKNN
jgi:hypothetical protein